MLISIAGWPACFAIGVALQRRLRDPHRLSHLIFMIVLWVLSPLVVIYAYTTVVLRPELLAAFACVIVANMDHPPGRHALGTVRRSRAA